MPELFGLLRSAADEVPAGPVPAFEEVLDRARRRRNHRRAGVLAIVGVLGAAGSLTLEAGSRPGQVVADGARPCVARDATNARDLFAAIPRRGTAHLTIAVGDAVTVGWETCGEHGNIVTSPDDPKQPLLAAPGSGLPVSASDVSSARFQAFGSGQVLLMGSGSQGSAGTLVISIDKPLEPVGVSQPSPFPDVAGSNGLEDICVALDAIDGTGRLTRAVSADGGSAVLEPAGGRPSRYTAEQTLARYRAGSASGGADQHARAVFGLLTDDGGSPFPHRLPVWVIVSCDDAHGEPVGGVGLGPEPAPGTSPSPGGQLRGEAFIPYDESGHALWTAASTYPDEALRSELLIDVPFVLTGHNSEDQRQIGIEYGTDDTCARFDHLDVEEPDASQDLHVRVWLHLLPGARDCTGTDDKHAATIGLRYPLGTRHITRGATYR